MATVEQILAKHARMKEKRGTWESHWQEVAERVLPRQNVFNSLTTTPGEKRSQKILDSTAVIGAERYASILEAMITPPTQRWHALEASEPELNKDEAVRTYFDELNDALFRARYAPQTSFLAQKHEVYMSDAAFGTGVLYIDEQPGKGFRYRAINLANVWIEENYWGIVDTVHREFVLTTRQAAQRFTEEKLPEKIQRTTKDKPDTEWTFIQCVYPNDERVEGRIDYRGMMFASKYIFPEDKQIIDEGGFNSMPFAIDRLVTAPGEVYGRSPGMSALADIKTLNEMERINLKAGHRAVEPPILLTSDGVLGGKFGMTPGHLNYGGLADDGTPRAIPFMSGANMPFAFEFQDRKRAAVEGAFFIDLFRLLLQTKDMTATQVSEIIKLQGMFLGSAGGRIESESLGPMVQREIEALFRSGVRLPEVPPQLIEAGAGYNIRYNSPLSRARRSSDAIAFERTIQTMAPLINADPKLMMNFESRQILEDVGVQINGMPQKWLRPKEDVEADMQKQGMLETAGQVAQMGPGVAAMAEAVQGKKK